MKTTNSGKAAGEQCKWEPQRPRLLVPAIAFFLAGVVLTAAWFLRGTHSSDTPTAQSVAISDATKSILKNLNAPVEVHFYSLLDPTTVSPPVRDFSGRIGQLLSLYEQAAGGHLKVVRSDASTTANAAASDGLKPFNIDKGDSCFLGIAVISGGQKETLPLLVPDWEQALESDLTRAIERVAEANAGTHPIARADTTSLDAVKRAIPNLDMVSVEDGTQMIRSTAYLQFKQADDAMRAAVNDAEQKVLQAQSEPSDAALQAAGAELQRVRAAGVKKLQQIALDAHAQIAALQQLKTSSP